MYIDMYVYEIDNYIKYTYIKGTKQRTFYIIYINVIYIKIK